MSEKERIEREVLALPHFALQLGEPGCKAHMFQIAHGYYVAHSDVASLVAREVGRAVRDEREACAKEAEGAHPHDGECCYEDPDGHRGAVLTAESIAAAIRARSAQGGGGRAPTTREGGAT